MEVYLGTILPWSIPFAPSGWHFCDGSLLQIQQYAALYSLIGTQYGGNGSSNFALPDLRGRSPIGTIYAGSEMIQRGTVLGVANQNILLVENNLPAHTHVVADQMVSISERPVTTSFYGTSDDGGHDVPQDGDYLGASTTASKMYRGALDTSTALSGVTGSVAESSSQVDGNLGRTGGGAAWTLSRVQPSMVINYIIALQGYYPQRP
ncbi:phage tail protein [Fusibacter sp. 3D3]|uniref:phage tail protein n=1 Tax=Fusibacter sp. 3D3 TaxID=1048380 RepID=UPI0008532BF2|nr:tail fiber protein [Fusibacter sp. 3D3]GAU78717.1 microcystin dependent protein [Fusibacter sp. 3D3]